MEIHNPNWKLSLRLSHAKIGLSLAESFPNNKCTHDVGSASLVSLSLVPNFSKGSFVIEPLLTWTESYGYIRCTCAKLLANAAYYRYAVCNCKVRSRAGAADRSRKLRPGSVETPEIRVVALNSRPH